MLPVFKNLFTKGKPTYPRPTIPILYLLIFILFNSEV